MYIPYMKSSVMLWTFYIRVYSFETQKYHPKSPHFGSKNAKNQHLFEVLFQLAVEKSKYEISFKFKSNLIGEYTQI